MANDTTSKRWLVAYVWRRRQIVSETANETVRGPWEHIPRSVQCDAIDFPDQALREARAREHDQNIEPDDVIDILSVTELPVGWSTPKTAPAKEEKVKSDDSKK